MEASLFTARPRAYMRQNKVPFREIAPGNPEFTSRVVPAVGRMIMPVLETPNGDLIQDGADIIDHLDQSGFSLTPLYPADPRLKVLAHVFELYGAHGLLKPAMHYRWSFDEINLPFIKDAFNDLFPPGLPSEAHESLFLHASGSMRKAATAVGVNEDTASAIEESYEEFLGLLNAHLSILPYLFGGHPTLADYGLIGALYAHLGRDPYPLNLMQVRAPRVFRWVERMNTAEVSHDVTLEAFGLGLIDGQALPDTLVQLLRFVAQDYMAEITAHVEFANEWLDQNPEVTAGASTAEKNTGRALGKAEFAWRGHTIRTAVVPYRFYLLCRLQDCLGSLSEADRSDVSKCFSDLGLEPLLSLKTTRRMERVSNQETWGEFQSGAGKTETPTAKDTLSTSA